jgi:2-succinyl-6-hydroxy-2,4-cyclohexadiene-1-carboxylate synthase
MGEEAMKTVLLHGFLGLPEDWQEFPADLKIHLWDEVSPVDCNTLAKAGERISELVSGDELTVIGYSLGGRIALHWPKEQWSRIRHLILISVHGGLQDHDEKQTRLQADTKWAERFLKEEWKPLMQAWNAQAVFMSDRVRPLRHERDFKREILAAALKNWSLGGQEEQTQNLASAPFPVTYVYGMKDKKFANYAKQLQDKGLPWSFKPVNGGHSLHLSHSHEMTAFI